MTVVHHYTSVETLALILATRKIRFNRLDQVDDVREAQQHRGIEFGKYFFVSCWTQAPEESIPQWHMYTDRMTGVRLTLPAAPFKKKKMVLREGWLGEQSGNLYAPLSFEEIFGESYFVVPMFTDYKNFAGPVEYVNDVERRYSEAVEVGPSGITIRRPFDLVRFKSKDWNFQNEYRFFLFVLPSIPVPPEGPGSESFATRFPEHCSRSMIAGEPPGIEYIDLELSDDAFSQLVVTTGPLCSPGARVCVEALVNTYAPAGRVASSCLTGTIRKPLR